VVTNLVKSLEALHFSSFLYASLSSPYYKISLWRQFQVWQQHNYYIDNFQRLLGKIVLLFLLLRKITELQCFVKGECQEGNYLGNSVSTNENDCLDYCHQLKGCKWFTYRSSSKVCQAFSECAVLNSSSCLGCLSGEASCRTRSYCETKGICKGSLLSTVKC
jgi:hypothetical protein